MKAGSRVRVTHVSEPEYYNRWAARIGESGVLVRSYDTRDGERFWVVDFEDGSEDQWMEFPEDELEVLD